jgi:hypothetical protein
MAKRQKLGHPSSLSSIEALANGDGTDGDSDVEEEESVSNSGSIQVAENDSTITPRPTMLSANVQLVLQTGTEIVPFIPSLPTCQVPGIFIGGFLFGENNTLPQAREFAQRLALGAHLIAVGPYDVRYVIDLWNGDIMKLLLTVRPLTLTFSNMGMRPYLLHPEMCVDNRRGVLRRSISSSSSSTSNNGTLCWSSNFEGPPPKRSKLATYN